MRITGGGKPTRTCEEALLHIVNMFAIEVAAEAKRAAEARTGHSNGHTEECDVRKALSHLLSAAPPVPAPLAARRTPWETLLRRSGRA